MDYQRNWALNQEKISQGRVTIVGCNALTHFLTFYMAGLGVRKIRIIDEGIEKGKNEFLLKNEGQYNVVSLEEKLMEINNELQIESVPFAVDESFIGNPDVLLDLSNNPHSKEICSEIFYRNKKIRLFVNASTSRSTASAIFKKDKSKVARLVSNDFLNDFRNVSQGSFTSGLMAAVILDEVRKAISPLERDYGLAGRLNYGLGLESRFSFRQNKGKVMERNNLDVLICGAGGIGTYTALNLILEGVNVTIYDGDLIASHNVARQLFYHDSIGQPKVFTLATKLQEIANNCRIYPRKGYIDEKNVEWVGDYDAIICCADNWKARQVLNSYAVKTNTALFNASVTAFSAMAESYLPGKNRCLECKYDFEKLIGLKPQSCADVQQSNVVMNNAFIGAFVAGEVLNKANTILDKKFEYHSKNGLKRKFSLIEQQNRGVKCKCC